MIEGHLGLRGVTVCGFLFAVWAAMFWCWDPLRIFPAFLFHHDQKEGGGICFSFLSFFCSSHTVSRSLFLCHAFCFAWPGDDRSGTLDFIFLSNNPKKFTAKVRANLKIFHRGRQRRVWGRAYERKNDRDEVLMGRYEAAAEVSYADRKKKSMFAVGLRGGIDLLSFWLTFFFPAVQQCIVSLPHTFTPKALLSTYLFIYFAVPSFSPTLSQINLCPSLPLCGRLKQPPSKHTQLYCSSQLPSDEISPPPYFPQIYSFHMGTPTGLRTL